MAPEVGGDTTAKIAMLEGRRWLGFEIDAEYVAIADRRLRTAERLIWDS